jgi:hypothetical protein
MEKHMKKLLIKAAFFIAAFLCNNSNIFAMGNSSTGSCSTYAFCTGRAFVTKIFGRAGDNIDRIGMQCSDGAILGYSFDGSQGVGGKGGNAFEFTSADGFNMLNGRSGSIVDQIEPFGVDGQSKGKAGGNGGNTGSIMCQPGQKINGMAVKTGNQVDYINILCK